MSSSSAPEVRFPTSLWVESELRRLSSSGVGVYVVHRGDSTAGLVLQKISDMKGMCHLKIQARNLEGSMVWVNALEQERVSEPDADAYIHRALVRDPDLWVVEIEEPSLQESLTLP